MFDRDGWVRTLAIRDLGEDQRRRPETVEAAAARTAPPPFRGPREKLGTQAGDVTALQ